jgi:colanic acid/amylovoran biosynthesis glycosyltransferase
MIEAQAANGLRRWAENFDHVTAMAPLDTGADLRGWVKADVLGADAARISLVPIPIAYRPDHFVRKLRPVSRLIRAEIAAADWLCFSLGGLFGDWGAVSAYEAHRMGRRFSVWTDRVESAVTRFAAETGHGKAALRAHLTHRPMAALEKFIIKRATLGLFHGKQTYDAYAPYSRQAELVHDIHLSPADHITPERLAAKEASVANAPLELIYVGRADPMKDPQDWLAVLVELKLRGVPFQAKWFGEGSQLDALRQGLKSACLEDVVTAPGNLNCRDAVFEELRAANVFLFCHMTPESPRCLIEALISGTPIVGYDGTFARDLVSHHDGGRFVPIGTTGALADVLENMSRDKGLHAGMIRSAAADGAPFDDETVFRHRSELIRKHL